MMFFIGVAFLIDYKTRFLQKMFAVALIADSTEAARILDSDYTIYVPFIDLFSRILPLLLV
jgi:hypothetical protein